MDQQAYFKKQPWFIRVKQRLSFPELYVYSFKDEDTDEPAKSVLWGFDTNDFESMIVAEKLAAKQKLVVFTTAKSGFLRLFKLFIRSYIRKLLNKQQRTIIK